MFERLADLDELILRCRTDEAKDYVREAVSCYRASAYRSAIVATWIAVVYDIVDKARELSYSGDSKAKFFLKNFVDIQDAQRRGDPDAIRRSLEFEKTLLCTATEELNLLSLNEKSDLDRLRDDRHRCAHPTMNLPEEPYRPSAELARLHIRNAVDHVLERPPVQGKAALERIEKEIASEYFPTDVGAVKSILQEGPLARPSTKLIELAVKYLIEGFFLEEKTASERGRYIGVINALKELHPNSMPQVLNACIKRQTKHLTDATVKYLISLIGYVDGIWDELSPGTKTKVARALETDQKIIAYKVFPKLMKYSEMQMIIYGRIAKASSSELSSIIKNGGAQLCLDRAVELFTGVRSWNAANTIAEEAVLPLVSEFTMHHIETVLRSPREKDADLKGAGGFNEFLKRILGRADLPKHSLEEIIKKEELEKYVQFYVEED